MKRTHLFIAALAIGVAACNKQQTVETEINVTLPEGSDGNEQFVSLIKNIEVLPLQTGDDYIYLDHADVYVGSRHIYCLYNEPHETLRLMCFDKASGTKTFARPISGRGPGECLGVECITGKNDSLILLDLQKGDAMIFNPQGRFVGKLNKERLNVATLYPKSDGGYLAFNCDGRNIDGDSCVNVLDSQLNIVAADVSVPDWCRNVASSKHGHLESWYVANDTLRYMFPYSHKLTAYPGGQTYNFISANPLSDAQKKSFEDIDQYIDAEIDGYESSFEEIIECGNIILFKYCVNDYDYRVAFDKTTHRVLTNMLPDSFSENDVTPSILWSCLIHGMHFVASDGQKLYAVASLSQLKPLTKYKHQLDARLAKFYNDIQATLAANVEGEVDDFSFMFTIELAKHIN